MAFLAASLSVTGCSAGPDVADPSEAASADTSAPASASESNDVLDSPSQTSSDVHASDKAESHTHDDPANSPNDPGDGVARDPQPAAPTQAGENGRITAQLQITTWSASRPFSAAGFVPGVVENGGKCTLTLTQGATRLSASGPATPNAADTVCAQGLIVDDARLASGEWNMQLTYSSARYQATSDISKVQVN